MTVGRIKKPILVIMTSLVLILGTFALAIQYQEAEAAPPRPCPDNIIGGSPINENIVVKAGFTPCTIENVTINGNIRVAKGASLFCGEDSTINGNIQARGAGTVDLQNCTISGNVSILNSSTVGMETVSIGGKLTLRGNNSVNLEDITVGGLATCARNTNQVAAETNFYNGGNNGCPQAV